MVHHVVPRYDTVSTPLGPEPAVRPQDMHRSEGVEFMMSVTENRGLT